MTDRSPAPPPVARWLLRLTFHAVDRDCAIADLDEEFDARAARDGAPAARRWYRDQARRSFVPALRRRLMASRRASTREGLARDFRYALRQFGKRPGFTIVSILTLALGFGANTAIFSAVHAILLKPLPVRDLDRIIFVQENIPKLGLLALPLDPTETLQVRSRSDLFDAVAGVMSSDNIVTGLGDPRHVSGARTVGDFFDVFGVVPLRGRFYRAEESSDGRHRVIVLSYDLWRELGADETIVGRSVQLNGGSFEVVGVAPEAFRYPRNARLWRPYALTPETREYHGRLISTTLALMRPAVTERQVQGQLEVEAGRLHPGAARGDLFFNTRGFVAQEAGQLRPALWVLFGAVACVLLTACANIASLQLVHGTVRAKELAVRAALGASRATLVRQLLIENVTLAAAGGVLGMALGIGLLQMFSRTATAQTLGLAHIQPHWVVLVCTAAATVASGLVFGLAPALRGGASHHRALIESGRSGSTGLSRHRVLRGAVVLQVALCLVLLLGSALMVRSLFGLMVQSPGFAAEEVATLRVTLAGPRFTNARMTQFYDSILERLKALPGIAAVGFVTELPFSGQNDSSPFRIHGRAADPAGPSLHANLHTVGGDYFTAMGIPLVRGRLFNTFDRKSTELVAVIDQTLARTFFPNDDPIGQRINQGMDATIVGIVGTVSQSALGEPAKATVYYPYTQHEWYANIFLTVRSALPLPAVEAMVRETVKSIDPEVPVYAGRMLGDHVAASLAPRRLTMLVLGALAAVSLVLAAFGLYAVISYAVSERAAEFGIRSALGAHPGQLRTIVMRQTMTLAIVGIAIGLAVAAAATSALAPLLFNVSSRDPLTFAAASLVLAVVAAAASFVPARRATRVNPIEVLRA
jgi:putative ABC transport system permease protein